MANLSSIARPYALAAFESARDQQQLPEWKAFLAAACVMVSQPEVVRLLNTPRLSTNDTFHLFNDVLSTLVDTERKNFLHLLAQNKRLNVLPEIADLFNLYYAALEKMSNVRVVTAIAIEQMLKDKFIQALSNRIQHEVTLQCDVDPAIIGGAIIHLGSNKVIDGSIRGQLTRLREALAG